MADNARGVLNLCIFVFVLFSDMNCSSERGPRMRILSKQSSPDTLMLPSNATSIREDITDNFSCENKTYGYYADVDNECQVFHVCLPVTYADGKNQTFRWSFICPESTVFNQQNFVCVREEDMTIKCEESEEYYGLNDNFGNKNDPEEDEAAGNDNEDSNQDADLPDADSNKPVDDNSVDNEQSAAQEDNAPQEDAKVKKDDETSRPQEDDLQKIDTDKRRNNRPEGNKRRKQNDRRNNY